MESYTDHLPRISLARIMRQAPEIPDHQVIRQIGSGAYGEVWLAKSLTGSWRAVKIVWREDFDDERTFAREFEGILRYEPVARNHPGLVHILHVGQRSEPNPFYYYVMELADDAHAGIQITPEEYIPRTLQSDKKLYGNKPMPLDYCLEVGSQLAHGLSYLHAQDLMHRDVKPANVVFVNGRPKLADIGLVAQRDQRSFVGTEGFIPPDGPGTARADVYALAKVLYEISTGKDRMDFPELPELLPEGVSRKRWLAFNEIICRAAEPRVDHCTMDSAIDLAEAIDELRNFNVTKKKRKSNSNAHPWRTWLLGVVIGVALTVCLVNRDSWFPQVKTWAYEQMNIKPSPPSPNGNIIIAPEQKEGELFITSYPAGASIYSSTGQYIDETPYGPIAQPIGTHLSFVLKKEGYANWAESGVVPAKGALAIGGILKPYRPPEEGKAWQDIAGTSYIPSGKDHSATDPVTVDQFQRFLNETKTQGQWAQENLPPTAETNNLSYIRTTPEAISAYTLWLNNLCEIDGLIGPDHAINPISQRSFESADGKLHVYRLVVSPVHKTPVTLLTSPAGASVLLNGRLIGVTPLEDIEIPHAPYALEFKLPGYATIRQHGINPQDLFLSLQLQPNNSVSFEEKWVNSLGLRFVPLNTNQLIGATEIRLDDYQRYLQDVGRPPHPKTPFPQSPNHPVTMVSREEAQHFAQWLTEKERARGIIEASDSYRLPTDEEWSKLVGLNKEQGNTPYARASSADTINQYTWGIQWPPDRAVGNYADQSALVYLDPFRTIANYDDGFPYTAPVASFAASAMGIYDLSGNVQEWVLDNYGGPANFRFRDYGVLRGGSYLSFRSTQLNTSTRTPMPAHNKDAAVGFRVILTRDPALLK